MTPRELVGIEFDVMFALVGDPAIYMRTVTDFTSEYAIWQVTGHLEAEGHRLCRAWLPTAADLRQFSRDQQGRKYDERRREIAKHLEETTAQTDKAIQMLRDRAQPRHTDECDGK